MLRANQIPCGKLNSSAFIDFCGRLLKDAETLATWLSTATRPTGVNSKVDGLWAVTGVVVAAGDAVTAAVAVNGAAVAAAAVVVPNVIAAAAIAAAMRRCRDRRHYRV